MNQANWHMENPEKDRVKTFQILGKRFRDHKSHLYVNYVLKGNEPFEDYNISKEDWEIFKKQKEDPKWKV